jgi:VWFA-related protein
MRPPLRLSLAAPVVAAGLLVSLPATFAQAPPAPPPAVARTTGVTAARVAVDLVVRDGKGRLVRDLKPGDLDLLEDGVRQEILSLRLVDTTGGARTRPAVAAGTLSGGAASSATPAPPADASTPRPAPATGPAPGRDEDEHPLYLALLFDRLSPQARQTACDAAIEWLRRAGAVRRHVGVFRIDRELEMLQQFTDDPAAVEQAIALVRSAAPTAYKAGSDRARLRELRQALLSVDESQSPAGAAGPVQAESRGLEVTSTFTSTGVNEVDKSLVKAGLRLQMAMVEAVEALERDQQGLATVNGLLAIVNGLKAVPGRKAVVFFSEGLALPPRVADELQAVVSEANRGGVTFYAAEAGGLRTVSGADETRRELAGIVQETSQGQMQGGKPTPQSTNLPSPENRPNTGGLAGTSSGRPMTAALERNEDVLRLDPASGLGHLARETGGFLVSDTNAIAKALAAADEDLASYYLVEYAPANELWDGRFRRIEVKVRRSGLRVQARQGYFAVRSTLPTPLLDFEAPVLAAMELAPRADEFAFRATAVQVPDQPGESAVPIAVEVAGDTPTLDRLTKEGKYQQDFTVLALVRDGSGRVVRKLSRRFATVGPLEKAEQARASRMLVLRETWLPAGRYTVEIGVQDAATGRLGVRRLPLEVPDDPPPSLRVSSLVTVGHAAPRPETEPESPSLVLSGQQIYPAAAAETSVSGGRPLPFFLVAQPSPGRAPLRAQVQLRRGDEAVFDATTAFTDAVGRSTLLGAVPLAGIEPGAYELRVTVEDGVDRAVRWTAVTVRP